MEEIEIIVTPINKDINPAARTFRFTSCHLSQISFYNLSPQTILVFIYRDIIISLNNNFGTSTVTPILNSKSDNGCLIHNIYIN